jgi:hypothetical protein
LLPKSLKGLFPSSQIRWNRCSDVHIRTTFDL